MKILIVKSVITQALLDHVDTQEELAIITTDGQDDQGVLTELSSIGTDYSMYGGSTVGASGAQSAGILLPPKAL